MIRLVAINGSHVTHSGSVFGGPVDGTVQADAIDNFVTINDVPIATSSAIMDVPTHFFTPLTMHAHQFNPTSNPHDLVYVNDKVVAVAGSSYPDDLTAIDAPIGQDFVEVDTA